MSQVLIVGTSVVAFCMLRYAGIAKLLGLIDLRNAFEEAGRTPLRHTLDEIPHLIEVLAYLRLLLFDTFDFNLLALLRYYINDCLVNILSRSIQTLRFA